MAKGRPTKYDPLYCAALIEHMEKGLSFESFAGAIRVSRDTIYEWVKQHKAFSDAKSIGSNLSRLWWEQQGQIGLFSESTYEEGKLSGSRSINATVWVFNMKNRFGWKDKQPEEVAQINQNQTNENRPITQDQLTALVKVARGEKS